MLEGGCYCGALRYSTDGNAVFKAQCHCRECQYISGGGPNYFMMMPSDGFTYTKGTAATFQRADLPNPVIRDFCPTCGTHIATRREDTPNIIVKVGTLDDPAAYGGPSVAIYTVDLQPFHHIPDGLPQAAKLPGK